MNICIYGASSAELEQIYYDKTEELGRMMAKRGHGLVFGALASLETAWNLADLMMALMTLCNLVAISILAPQAILLLKDYISQKKNGIKSPTFNKNMFEEKIRKNIPYWD